MEVDYSAIGKRIRKFRLERGMTQETVSERSGVTPTHFSHIETGNTKVSLPTLLSIAEVLDVTMDDLLCANLVRTKHVSLKEMAVLLEDCTDAETRALVSITETSKQAIRKLK